MRLVFTLILITCYLSSFSQDSGTFKVSKKEFEQEKRKNRNRSNKIFAGYQLVINSKSNPELTRSLSARMGLFLWDLRSDKRFILSFGITGGYAFPNKKYKGTSLGVFASIDYALPIGAYLIRIPLEVSYKKLINRLDYKNLNQYTVTSGLKIPVRHISGLKALILGSYIYENNSIDKFNGFYPSIGFNYWF